MSTLRPFRCFDGRVIRAALLVAAWFLVGTWWSRDLPPASIARVVVAFSQAGALAALVLMLGSSILRLDELGRQIHFQALSVVAAVLVTLITGGAFLARAGLPAIDWSTYAAPVFVLGWAVGVVWIARGYE